MNRIPIYKYILTTLSLVFMLSGCIEHFEEVFLPATDYVSFKATLSDGGVPTKGFSGNFDFEVEDWILDADAVPSVKSESGTQASAGVTLYSSLNGLNAGVYGYVYTGEWSSSFSPSDLIADAEYVFDGDQLDAKTPVRWTQIEKNAAAESKFKAFVYAPKDAVTPVYQDQSSSAGAPVIKVSDVFAKDDQGKYLYQKDILVADTEVGMNMTDKTHRRELALEFQHIYTALQFKAGFACTIKSVSISGIKTSGEYVLGTGWTSGDSGNSSTNDPEFSMEIPGDGLLVNAGKPIGGLILMIPQEIDAEDATISVTYSDDEGEQTIVADLTGVEWRQGKKITYTLKKESDRKYIYLDLAAGNVTINGSHYTGYVFAKKSDSTEDEKVPIKVEGNIAQGQEYYIYQSCVTDLNNSDQGVNKNKNYKVGYAGYDVEQKKFTGDFTLPSYPPVTYNDQLWADYITNNTSVEDVIEAWDDKAGAKSNEITNENKSKAVRLAGRESTKNRIHVSGVIGDCAIIIDNIYSSYHEKSVGRTTGGIAYLPNFKSILTIHLKGDNRVGCVHYSNTTSNGNKLIFDGEGSLTVADADFNTVSHNGNEYPGVESMGERTYFSNHWCAAIGNNDSADKCFGIIFKGGTIYAGTTKAENCTAIGGGGNGYGEVTIEGGTITAVATTTGTAIGGGIGYNSAGGEGNVTINGGNVYAYNFANRWNIPSSAIGGAGSRKAKGSQGKVTITAGNVYAVSALGTAIGGGSSAQKYGGMGIVNIKGGNIVARSYSKNSSGIGGGSSYTESFNGGSSETKNGGDAEITIEGNPIIRTGSIGGGSPGKGEAKGGKIGSAQIEVSGGDIQAQFVMADSQNNVFNMTKGVIRNSATSDEEYYCIQENGGAVYMEKGIFTMSDGTIKECSADKSNISKGGAVYIKGGNATISGGEILECEAKSDGGALYIEGGSVAITGGTISGNVAYNGNGGAVCIMGGGFSMDGTTAKITQNAAFNTGSSSDKGNGGGIYIAPAGESNEISLIRGEITSNSSDRNGGGVCVDMGSNNSATLNVIVGPEPTSSDPTPALADEEPISAPFIMTGNNAQSKGGGIYVKGENVRVMLWDGYILYNQTSAHQVNPNISVDGGLVTLNKKGITQQVTITFNNNAQYYTQGSQTDSKHWQYVVAASKSKLENVEFEKITDYYNTFKGWNTRRDGKGESYTDVREVTLNEDLILYAIWANQ